MPDPIFIILGREERDPNDEKRNLNALMGDSK
ncbi:hypothetical protein C5167_041662 [Papaver somniferum]|nr:hypothetical protein C5167_041662 [Papaver somniferum]